MYCSLGVMLKDTHIAKLTSQIYAAEHHSRGQQLLGHSIVSQHSTEPEGSLPNSQELSSCSYPMKAHIIVQ
jgi:hypothetical protein